MQNQVAIKAESTEWQSAHYKEPYYSIRTAKLPRKLREIGILNEPRNIRILDTCCGRGEALRALREHGFINLAGIDATPQTDHEVTGFAIHHGDVKRMPFPDATFDFIINLHALHHMGGPDGVAEFLSECRRVLKPGGKLAIIDFPASLQIRLLFWLLRTHIVSITGGLRNFAEILEEEWSYLGPYLRNWPAVRQVLDRSAFRTLQKRQRFFLYYWTLMPSPTP